MEFVQKATILTLNEILQREFGGRFVPPHNLLNEAPLDYVLDAISSPVFGEDLYPDVFAKAAALLCTVAKQHVFHDGNKRTGAESARLFLRKNGYLLMTVPEDADFMIGVAECRNGHQDTTEWLHGKCVQV